MNNTKANYAASIQVNARITDFKLTVLVPAVP